VLQNLKQVFTKSNIAFMVGGSGLYIDAVLNGVDDFIEVPNNVREKLNDQFATKGLIWLQKEVEKHDPIYFNSVDVKNPQRLIRALEVIDYTGLQYSSFLNKEKIPRKFVPVKILINTNREKLYEKINWRVDEMMANGLLEEVKKLSAYRNLNALKTVGYKELCDFLDGKLSLENAIDKIKQHTRNYAKRQITWFKNKENFTEFEPDNFEGIVSFIDSSVAISENRKL